MERSGKYERPEGGKFHPKLGRTLPSDYSGRDRGLLPRRLEGKTTTLTLEREKFEEVLTLTVIIMADVLYCKYV